MIEQHIRQSFLQQRNAARRKGHVFTLTFDQWWQIWAPHWCERGRQVGQKWMFPVDESLGYVEGNVRVVTVLESMVSRNPMPRGTHVAWGVAEWIAERGFGRADPHDEEVEADEVA